MFDPIEKDFFPNNPPSSSSLGIVDQIDSHQAEEKIVSHPVLVVDSSFRSRKELVHDLRNTGQIREVIEAHSVSHALELLVSKMLSMCFVGPSLSEESAVRFVKQGRNIVKDRSFAFVAVVDPLCASLNALIEAGADTVLNLPYSKEHFSEALGSAVSISKENKIKVGGTTSSGTDEPEELSIETTLNATIPSSLSAALLCAATELHKVSNEIERGKLKITAEGLPTASTKEIIRRAFEKAFCRKSFEAQIPGTQEYLFISAAVDWFSARIYTSEKLSTEQIRKKLLNSHKTTLNN